jgi:hypothetical protein
MRYEKPEFVEIKMDAEIGSYQSDFDQDSDPPFVEGVERVQPSAAE